MRGTIHISPMENEELSPIQQRLPPIYNNRMRNSKKLSGKIQAAVLAGVVAAGLFFYFNHRLTRYQISPGLTSPIFLTFDELKKFSQNPHPGASLEKKLQRFWRTPLVSNEAYYAGAKPLQPADPQLGPYLRLVSWNIEKSIHMKDAITVFSSPEAFPLLIDP